MEDASNEPELHHALRSLLNFREQLSITPRRRPWIALWRTADRVTQCLFDLVDHYLAALNADLPLDAQHFANQGQRDLDRAAAEMHELSDKLATWKRIEETTEPQGLLVALAIEACHRGSQTGLLGLEEAGQSWYEKVTRTGEMMPRGLGIGLMLTAVQAEFILDEQRLWDACHKVWSHLTIDPARLHLVTTKSSWLPDIKDAAIRHYDGAVACQSALTLARGNRQEIRALLELGLVLLEGPGRRYLASLLAVAGLGDYERLREADSGELLQLARTHSMGDLLLGLDRAIRISKAHETFEIVGDQVVLRVRNKPDESISVDELVNRILAGLETVLSLHAGLICATASIGIEVEETDALVNADVPIEEVVAFLLGLNGWADIEVELVDTKLICTGRAEVTSRTLLVIASILPYLPEAVTSVTLTGSSPGGTHTMTGPVEVLRLYQARQSELEKQIRIVAASCIFRLDGAPILSTEAFAKWTASMALKALSLEFTLAIPQLRSLIALCRQVDMPDMEALLQRSIAALRGAAIGMPDQSEAVAIVGELQSYAKRRVPQPFDV